jgi:hypothetical protein
MAIGKEATGTPVINAVIGLQPEAQPRVFNTRSEFTLPYVQRLLTWAGGQQFLQCIGQ